MVQKTDYDALVARVSELEEEIECRVSTTDTERKELEGEIDKLKEVALDLEREVEDLKDGSLDAFDDGAMKANHDYEVIVEEVGDLNANKFLKAIAEEQSKKIEELKEVIEVSQDTIDDLSWKVKQKEDKDLIDRLKSAEKALKDRCNVEWSEDDYAVIGE